MVKSVWERWDKYAILSFHLSNCLDNELVPYHPYIMNLRILNGLTTIIIIEAQICLPSLATGSVLPTREQEPCPSMNHCVSCTYNSLGSMTGA